MRARIPTLLLTLALAACSGEGCGASSEAGETQSAAAPESGPPPLEYPQSSAPFEALLAELDAQIAKTQARAAADSKSWLVLEKLAGLYLRRAKLSGDYDDYGKAEQALADAFARAPAGTGPVLTRAQLNLSMHRLDRVEPDLDTMAAALLIDQPTQAVIAGMRGDLAMQRGNYPLAQQLLDEALALDRNTTSLSRKALWLWQTGEFEAAEAHYRDALALIVGDHPDTRAWVHLQLGLMDLDRGRLDDAFVHYRDAAGELSGWWLIDEHVAEIAALTGRNGQARTLYDSIVARTDKGEFMDALAELERSEGDEPGAQPWIERARARFEDELARWPEASYGHALGHFLAFGPPARALELAEANHRLRPNAEAKRDLAQARLDVDDVAGAKTIIDEALATPVERADLLWLAASIHARAGDASKADHLRTQALAIDPTLAP
jgi:tetratricopeptide (TPR) repeat protein